LGDASAKSRLAAEALPAEPLWAAPLHERCHVNDRDFYRKWIEALMKLLAWIAVVAVAAKELIG
jgi:beta-lactamase regulating signal transducer with metallopeptidase domain